ncbi:ABC transporter substrate-binding protein [Paenibacillus nasutitermitis]|uniref:Sugar ABC transporter substrate-binding protein n=1 Tax=Paenibacillus nasutitermitis TaxID=1652958 RepID=A0A917E0I3_9BACL|nr:ABC transporter substrate-binding protein [Paenibacillus nasutitermitis]GGD85468.1 sugar ABC transporter substrate-binding protein [Paenibacillus nasutitermitis]
MKKLLLSCLISMLTITSAACSSAPSEGNDSKSEGSTDSGTKSGTMVQLKFSSYQSGDVSKDWETIQFPAYKKETGVDVEHVFIKHEDTISTLMMWNAANTMPDAGMLSADYENALAAKGMLVNLSELIKEKDPNYDLGRFFPKLLDAYKYKDELYALPSDLDLGLLWYNKDMFDAAGIAYPDENWTWDDYLSAATKLTSGDGPAKIYGTKLPSPQTFLWQNNADIISADGKNVTIDSPEGLEAITFISDLVNKYKVAPKSGANDEDKFQTGRAAMSLGEGPWYAHYGLKDVKFNWGIAPMPKGKQKATTAYGSTFAIFSSSKHQDEAWEFIKWFLSDEQQFIRAKQFSWFPPSSSVLSMPDFVDESVLQMSKDQKELVMKEAEYGRAPVVVEKQNEANQIINRELKLVWSGEKKPEDALNTIKTQVQPLLK